MLPFAVCATPGIFLCRLADCSGGYLARNVARISLLRRRDGKRFYDFREAGVHHAVEIFPSRFQAGAAGVTTLPAILRGLSRAPGVAPMIYDQQ